MAIDRGFRPLRRRMRATFSAAERPAEAQYFADAKSEPGRETLRGVQIVLEGEAKGHGVWLDRAFCEAVAEAGNATGEAGLKVRYGHPSMCADAIGTELGRAHNFRVSEFTRTVDGAPAECAAVVADVAILKSAHSAPQGDIARHVLEVAAEDPSQFGMSIVFTYADWAVVDEAGVRHSYNEEVGRDGDDDDGDGDDGDGGGGGSPRKTEEEWLAQSADGRVYAVLGRLHGADFTDTPAATDGIFSTGTLAEEAERMLDEHPEVLAAIERDPRSLVEFLDRTGLSARLESARVRGLQSAKDGEIAQLRAEISILRTTLVAKVAKIESLESDAAGTAAALSGAKALEERLRAELDGAKGELSRTKAALEAERERYRGQVGPALRPPAGANAGRRGLELVRCSFGGGAR